MPAAPDPIAPAGGAAVNPSAPAAISGAGGAAVAPAAPEILAPVSRYVYSSTPKATARNWIALAGSSDLSKLVAVAVTTNQRQLLTSADGGLTWTARESVNGWADVASSADGTKLVACVRQGKIYTSEDSGETWLERDSDRPWTKVACSNDGAVIAAITGGGTIYVSTNSGVSFTPRVVGGFSSGITVSGTNGSTIVACFSLGDIQVSKDAGVTWASRAGLNFWSCVAASDDGNVIVAGSELGIWVSTDGGLIWEQKSDGVNNFCDISADGDVMILSTSLYGRITTSTDRGEHLQENDLPRQWTDVVLAADGLSAIAGVNEGFLYAIAVPGGEPVTAPAAIAAAGGAAVSPGAPAPIAPAGGAAVNPVAPAPIAP